MTLRDLDWNQFKNYLIYELKWSQKPSALMAAKSKFLTIQRFFNNREFTRENFRVFLQECDEKGLSNAYKNKFIATAKHVGGYLDLPEWEKKITYFRENRPIVKSEDLLTVEEIIKIGRLEVPYSKHRNFINHRNRLLSNLLGCTGCRISEALELTQNKVYSNEIGAFVIFVDTKNGEDRKVSIPPDLYRKIKSLPQYPNNLIFVSAGTRKKLSSQEIVLDWKRRARILGIKKNIYSHLYRHSYITRMLEAHADVIGVAKTVGHRNPRTTMGYDHSSDAYLVDVALNDPMRKDELTYEHGAKKVKEFVRRSINTNKITPKIYEDERGTHIILPKY